MKEPSSAAGELLQTLADHVAQSAKETLHVSDELAEAHGAEVARQMATVWGGQQVYMPEGIHVQASKLHQQIFDEWKGVIRSTLAPVTSRWSGLNQIALAATQLAQFLVGARLALMPVS
ncbi:Mor transcription activator family protein [Pseudomonas sp. ok272]|uniref:Mor transcription activator family protein n=1 Tax=Pseudomonas sp. ok272 TaxID=1761897 RepID=UPI0008B9DCE6|nr:Mor transcription activator family protein [Pseudomonas sp. ok272]SEN56576.1 Mor transcription activator family protein [Pseudomonas sp. ok272]